jgi:myo-inositol 2-dehydrogenase/D-chiro-inositol 1-dehydrogenase
MSTTRRNFIKASSLLLVTPATAFAATANEKIRVGIIGSGQRGAWIGRLFQEDGACEVTALHDYFRDRVDHAGDLLGVPPERRFVGFDGYLDLLASGVDAVAIESPPYFHPEQTMAAIDAGVHVFLAKPVAVDVWGCQQILAASEKAGDRLSLLVDFQTRNDPYYREAVQKVREGVIGTPQFGQAWYQTGRLGITSERRDEIGRLRNWTFDIALSGDIIVEQNIHCLDVANWLLDAHPVEAHGVSGRLVRTDIGDAMDHYVCAFKYPGERWIDFSSNQFAPGCEEIRARVHGVDGTCDTQYGGAVWIQSRAGRWPGGETTQIYRQGAVNNIRDFLQGIHDGTPVNTAVDGVNSTLTCILGRMAAQQGKTVSWDEMMASGERLDAGLDLPDSAIDSPR